MNAIVLIDYAEMQGKSFGVHECKREIVTLRVPYKFRKDGYRLISFTLNEVRLCIDGNHVSVFRNQAFRDGNWIDYKQGKGYVLSYKMPNGREFINVCKNPYKLDEYTTMTPQKFMLTFRNIKNYD